MKNGNALSSIAYDANTHRTKRSDVGIDSSFSISNFEDYMNNTRETINVNLPTDYDQFDHPNLIGKSVGETFQLNRKWMIRAFRFFVYYTVGIVFYSQTEGWNIRTCVYFITQTVSTVGYGNISPATYAGQTFCIFYMFTGIMLVFSVVGDITSWFVKYMRRGYTKPIKRSRVAILVRNVINATMWIGILMLLLVFGATVISLNEGWSFHTAFYFCAVTATSIGYGDFALQKSSSIWFNIFFILLSVSTTALALDKIGNVKRHIVEAEQDQQLNNIELTQELLAAISKERLRVTPSEYVLHMLQLAGKLDRHADIEPWLSRFGEFDLDHDGLLTMHDVDSYAQIVRRIDLGKISRKRPNKKKSILLKISEETRDVFLETFKLKEADAAYTSDAGSESDSSSGGRDVELGAVQPRRSSQQTSSATEAARRRGAESTNATPSTVFSPIGHKRPVSSPDVAVVDSDSDQSGLSTQADTCRPFQHLAQPASPSKTSSLRAWSQRIHLQQQLEQEANQSGAAPRAGEDSGAGAPAPGPSLELHDIYSSGAEEDEADQP